MINLKPFQWKTWSFSSVLWKVSPCFSFKSCGVLPPSSAANNENLTIVHQWKTTSDKLFCKKTKRTFLPLCPEVICFRQNGNSPHLRGAVEKAHLKFWDIRSREFSPPSAFLLQSGLRFIHGYYSSWNTQPLRKQNNVLQFFTASVLFNVFCFFWFCLLGFFFLANWITCM